LLLIKQNLLGLGWKFLLLWRSWLEGLIIWRRNALNEFAFAITANSHRLDETRTTCRVEAARPGWELRWILHLNEPGWVVGAHKHVLVVACGFEWGGGALFEAMEWNGMVQLLRTWRGISLFGVANWLEAMEL
jgi:hypothetical protein